MYLGKVWSSVSGWVDSEHPCTALEALVAFAGRHGLQLGLDAEARDVLAATVARVASDLHVLRRKR